LLVGVGCYAVSESARRALGAGEVRLNDAHKTLLEKPGQLIDATATFLCAPHRRYVSRGGDKLAGALAAFDYEVTGLRCLDVGASTGGFTDCLLQAGAAQVTALDVAYGIIDWKLRGDDRVTVVERCNIRNASADELTALGAPFDLLVADLSFISLAAVFPALRRCTGACGEMLLLVKPQFEAERKEVGVGGIVRDQKVQRAVLERLEALVRDAGVRVRGWTYSPIKGAKGNIEFWLWVGSERETPCDNENATPTAGIAPADIVTSAHKRLD